MLLSIFGDSIMAGVVQEDGHYSRCKDQFSRLEEETGAKLDNHSSFGSTVVKGYSRLEKFLQQGKLGEYTLIEFGGNDCAYDWAEVAAAPDSPHLCVVPPEEFEKDYEEILRAVIDAGSIPVAATLPPISSQRYLNHVCRDGLDSNAILHWLGDLEAISRWQQGYSAMVSRVAERLGCLVLDLRSVFPASGPELEQYLCQDGIHPNRLGQKLMYEKAVLPMLSL
jgi:lysophospholipase L1-like esterase